MSVLSTAGPATGSPTPSGQPTDGPVLLAHHAPADLLPRWPVSLLLGLFPLWWALGLIDMILVPAAAVMALYLARSRGARVPVAFGLWLVFLVWAAASVIEITTGTQLVGFGYRYLVYLSATVLFVYVYNARRSLDAFHVCALLTAVWLTTVVGGYLGVLFPTMLVKTPMAYLMEAITPLRGLLANDLVNHMVIRRFSQYNPGSYFQLAPRPSAPFRYTNNWGNVYSILLPVVVAHLIQLRRLRLRRFWWLLAAMPLSLVPAFLTLNRGMMLGIGVTVLYVGARLALAGRPRYLAVFAALGVLAYAVFLVLPVQERIDNRLGNEGDSNATRTSLYSQSFGLAKGSPVFGYGVPVEGDDPNAPPVGTQGQVWVVLVSHGPIALGAALGWFGLAVWQSRRRRDLVGLAVHTSLLVSTMELFYYGAVPYGLPLMMLAAALALRRPDASLRPVGAR